MNASIGINDLMKNHDLSKRVLEYSKPEGKVGLEFELRHTIFTPRNQETDELEVDRKSQTYTFAVGSAFYNNISPEKKQKLCNICSLLFKMKLLKSRRTRQFNQLGEIWADSPLDVDIIDFINRYFVEWSRYINEPGEDDLLWGSRADFNNQVNNEYNRRNIANNEYKMLFCFGENRDGYSPSPPNSYFPRFIPCADVMILHLNEQFLIRAGYSHNNQIGYIKFQRNKPDWIAKWFIDYASVIGSFICRLNNRKIHIKGAPLPYNYHNEGNLGTEDIVKWEWKYIDSLYPEDAEKWRDTALLARSIRPVRGKIAEFTSKLKF